MRNITKKLLIFFALLLQGYLVEGQDIDFNLRYNGAANVYEVYARPAFTDSGYFVGGGSQISIVLPEIIGNSPLSVNSANGGLWTDNSQVYAPAADPGHDFHGVASNGAFISFTSGVEILLFTFDIPGGGCAPDLRIFENGIDPNSAASGMGGGDFENFFANVFDPFNNNWRSNYLNSGLTCPEPPVVLPNPITVMEDSTGSVCLPILDLNVTDTFTASICTGSPSNGVASSMITGNEVCITYTPNPAYTGTDSICLIVCDASLLCDTLTVPVTVVPGLPVTTDPSPPVVIITPIITPEDSTVSVCTPVLDPNVGDTFTTSLCTGSPANGTATPTVVGNTLCIEYSPNVGYTGDDDICVIVCDQTGLCDTVSVPVTIVPTPESQDSLQTPVVVMPPIVVPEDSTLTSCGPIIDANPNDTHTVSICGQPANGTATASVDNTNDQLCITIDPDPNFTGSDNICVIVCDQGGLCDTLTVPIEVIPVNDPPLAINDINSTQVDNPVNGNVLVNDSDPEGDTLTVNTTPINETNGTATVDAAGNYIFTPDPGFSGTASFQYVVCDDGVPIECDTATVVIEVIDNNTPTNNGLVGMPDNFVTDGDSTLTANVLSNDSDPDGDSLIINTTPVTNPSNGTVTISPDGTVNYTPTPGFTGTEIFEYEVCDTGTPTLCDTVMVTIEVLPDNGTNDLYATDDANSGEEGYPQSGNVTDNDNDPENNNLTVNMTPLFAPLNGTLTLAADGSYTYLPNPGFIGNDIFIYRVCDDGSPIACDSATVYLTVLISKDPPVVIPNPITTPMDSSATVCMPIIDPNIGDTFTANLCPGSPTNGTATATVTDGTVCVDYNPTPGFEGSDEVCLIICDQTGRCDTVSVPVTVIAPLVPIIDPQPPIVIPTPMTTPEDSTVNLCTPILDPNVGDTFTASLCPGSPTNGTATPTVVGNTLCMEYSPNPGFTGNDDICVIVCDQSGLCDTISVPVTIIPTLDPADSLQAPIVIMPPVVAPEDSTVTVCGPIVDVNTDDTHTATICAQPANGTVTTVVDNVNNELCISLDPDPNFTGSDSVCVIVCDQSGFCDTLTVPIEILPINDPPMAINDVNTTQIDIPVTGNVLINDTDPEGDQMTVNTTPINPVNGTVTIDSLGNYTVTPDPGFIGTVSFEYEVCDNGNPVACDTAIVLIEVIDVSNPNNNNVVGVADHFVTEDDNPLTGDLLSNDSDPDGDSLFINVVPVTSPGSGTLVINPDGTFTYTPVPGTTGTESFSYEVCDNGTPQACDTVVVTIEILPGNGVNDVYATDDANSGNENDPQLGNVTDNDNDPENGVLTVMTTPLDAPDNGSLVMNTTGTYTYQPNLGFTGNDQFTYMVCDDGSPMACDSATVYLTVLNIATELRLKVMLHGALFGATDSLMRADLVAQNLVPLTQPYDLVEEPLYASRFVHVGGGSEVTTTTVLNANAGTPDAIVDWVYVELRDATDSVTVIRTVSALVQRDGDIVDAATGSKLYINGLPDQFFVVVKHRNHLGAMTASPVTAPTKLAIFDFTTAAPADLYHDAALPAYDGLEQISISGHQALWAGNANADVKVKYDGTFNDRIIIAGDVLLDFGNGGTTLNFNNAINYYQGDINLDGKAKYDGFGNDRILLQAIVLTYPLNGSFLNNFNELTEQVK